MKTGQYFFYCMVLLTGAFLSQITIASTTTDPRMLIKLVQEKMKSAKSVSYDIHYRFKYFDEDDTMTLDSHVDILRNPEDSLARCYLLMRQKNGFIKLYDTKKEYFINPKDTSIEIVDVYKYHWPVTEGNTADEMISKAFIDPSKIDSYYDSSMLVYDSSRGNELQPLKVFVTKQESQDGVEMYPQYEVVDPDIHFKIFYRQLMKWQGKFQYSEISFSNVEFDKLDSNYFLHYHFPKGYRFWDYVPKKDETPLVVDTIAPDFIAKKYPDTTQSIHLFDYRGKIVILDFWYTSCYPCIQALPGLDKISKQYIDRGVIVLGVNSTDLRVKRIHKLPDFFSHNPISYSTVFPDQNVDEAYHVTGYPTMYVIDRNGKIVLSQVGYSEIVDNILTNKLDELLK